MMQGLRMRHANTSAHDQHKPACCWAAFERIGALKIACIG